MSSLVGVDVANLIVAFIVLISLECSSSLQIKALDSCRPDAFTFCEMPVITSLSEEPYPAFPGESFRVQCEAYGSPQPAISWFRVLEPSGESMEVAHAPGSHVINEDGTLKIQHVVPHDDGKYYCVASNSAGESRALIEIKVSHPLVMLIPLSVGDTFVKLTWNGSVSVFSVNSDQTTQPEHRHRHHIETRYRLSRHLVLKYRRYKDYLPSATSLVKLSAHARHFTVSNLSPNTPYEFCIEFQPSDRPTTLLDCLIVRTTSDLQLHIARGYHEGRGVLFLLLMVIVGSGAFVTFSCYALAVGRKLWKYRNKKGFSSLGYDNEAHVDHEHNYHHYAHHYPYYEENPRIPLIAKI